ncbi:MAG: TonB-dependent receptor [Candidatus Latescibacterota bacterium]|nr:TonB-dependent receptor [Candidatus Latescibacterota bacterium]
MSLLNLERSGPLIAVAILSAHAAMASEMTTTTGKITDAATGAPVAGANIASGSAAASTGQDGHFHLSATVGDSLTITHIGYHTTTAAVAENVEVALAPALLQGVETVIRAGLTSKSLQQSTASVSVIKVARTRSSGERHLQDLTAQIPNLNWAGGSSRPRYFQIRGIGERSHYAGEGPPNFSVGFVMDDVDLSGLGMAGMLFDIDQVEIYKGPQSTMFGPSAMAGLISLRSAEPVPSRERAASVTFGNEGHIAYDASVNAPLTPMVALRAGFHRGRSDGFHDNAFLNEDDTNRRRETMARVKLGYHGDNGVRFVATGFVADIDNGYDAWAPDNNEALHTYSDHPGVDAQFTQALSLRGEIPIDARTSLVTISAITQSELEHAFDGDWGNDAFWLAEPYSFDKDLEGWSYDFFDHNLRNRKTLTQELRVVREGDLGHAVVGVYGKRFTEKDDREGYVFGGDAAALESEFEISDLAFYGQVTRQLSSQWRATMNLRADRNATDYSGATDGGVPVVFDVSEWLTGGKLAISGTVADGVAYAAVSRGYRSGGVNQHPRLDPANRPFESETLINYEIGFRRASARTSSSIAVFYNRRSSQQVDLSSQQNLGDPNSFVYFTANAANGRNAGIEAEQRMRLNPHLDVRGSLGYLNTHVDPYTFATAQGDATLGDREAAHAPQYSLCTEVVYRPLRSWQARAQISAVDEFLFSDSHNEKSEPYQLVNASIGYEGEGWSLKLWSRNLFNERYAVRGFFFGLEPPDFPDRLYITHGDPREVGVTLTTDLFSR